MTYSSARPALNIRLIPPMQMPEALSPKSTTKLGNEPSLNDKSSSVHLCLCPGEPSELIVQISNPSDRCQQISYTLTGNFPRQWCPIGGAEGYEVLPHQQINVVLYFDIEEDFFERHTAVQPGTKLELNYQGQLRIHSTFNGRLQRQTHIQCLNLYVRPDSLYLNFLPDLYREVDLIGRLLKIFELGFEPTVQTLDNLWAYLNPSTAPKSMLPFLAYWLGWPTDVPWDVATQRKLIRRAMELYRWRGTRRGLRLYLYLYTSLSLDRPDTPEEQRQICIQEVFDRGFVFGRTRLGSEAILGGSRPYHFIVRLRSRHPESLDRRLIHTIIKQEKPAFCSYDLHIESLNNPVPATLEAI